MAVHRLDDKTYLSLRFNKTLWEGYNTQDLNDLLPEFFPPILSKTSVGENRDLAWIYGMVGISGKGQVEVLYPYQETHSDSFRLKNVSFGTFSFLHLKAKEIPGWRFSRWADSENMRNTLTHSYNLLLSEADYLEVTGFVAIFEQDDTASDVGI